MKSSTKKRQNKADNKELTKLSASSKNSSYSYEEEGEDEEYGDIGTLTQSEHLPELSDAEPIGEISQQIIGSTLIDSQD